LPCSPALAFFYFSTISRGYHPLLVRTAENSAMPQKWYYRGPNVRCPSQCTVGASSGRHSSARLSTQELRTQQCRQAPRGCQGSSWVSAGTHTHLAAAWRTSCGRMRTGLDGRETISTEEGMGSWVCMGALASELLLPAIHTGRCASHLHAKTPRGVWH